MSSHHLGVCSFLRSVLLKDDDCGFYSVPPGETACPTGINSCLYPIFPEASLPCAINPGSYRVPLLLYSFSLLPSSSYTTPLPLISRRTTVNMAREITRSRSSTPPTPPPLNPNVLPESVVPEVSMVEAEDVTGVTFTPEYVLLFLSLPLSLLSSFFPLSICRHGVLQYDWANADIILGYGCRDDIGLWRF